MNSPIEHSQKIMNPHAIAALYGHFFSFENSELLDLKLRRDEPCLSIRLQTSDIPIKSPSRWPDHYDVVYVDLSFIVISDLQIKGWGHHNVLSKFEIIDKDEKAGVFFSSIHGLTISFLCDWIRIENLTPGLLGTP